MLVLQYIHNINFVRVGLQVALYWSVLGKCLVESAQNYTP